MGRKGRQRSLSPVPSLSSGMVTIREAIETKSNVTPSKFYGNACDEFENWIKTFERIGRANRWGPDRKVELLLAYLRDCAADFYEDLDQAIQEDFDTLIDRMKEIFCPKSYKKCTLQECPSKPHNQVIMHQDSKHFMSESALLVNTRYTTSGIAPSPEDKKCRCIHRRSHRPQAASSSGYQVKYKYNNVCVSISMIMSLMRIHLFL